MLKVSHFRGQDERGVSAIPLFGKADAAFEKCASGGLLPDVVKYIESLRPSNDSQYVLVNAMGAGEYYGSNINGDHFPEASLIHMPDNWTGTPAVDRIVAKDWEYGFPTFYNAHPYAHHRNKDASRAFGTVELATWNQNMKRVELVVKVDREKCLQFGGEGVWDKLRIGEYPDVSMGTKVPYDTCSICLDWDLYREAQASKDPQAPSTGQKILAFHRRLKAKDGVGIRGVSVTRKDYCVHALDHMSRILPDGRKVWVYNDYPRFFDISFVFIGADRTAKVMLFIFRNGKAYSSRPSAEVAETLGVKEPEGTEKAASVSDELLKSAFGKLAKPKRAEIEKDTVPSQFAGKAVPILTKSEEDLPRSTLDGLGSLPIKDVLSTLTGLGILLRPREYQRITLIQMSKRDLADELEDRDEVFEESDDTEHSSLDRDRFSQGLAEILMPFLQKRSALGPLVEKRVLVSGEDKHKEAKAPSHSKQLLAKIAAAYNGYRQGVMDLVAHSQDLLSAGRNSELKKLGSAAPEQIFTPLSVAYLQHAFRDEFGVPQSGVIQLSTGASRRGEGFPLEEHVAN